MGLRPPKRVGAGHKNGVPLVRTPRPCVCFLPPRSWASLSQRRETPVYLFFISLFFPNGYIFPFSSPTATFPLLLLYKSVGFFLCPCSILFSLHTNLLLSPYQSSIITMDNQEPSTPTSNQIPTTTLGFGPYSGYVTMLTGSPQLPNQRSFPATTSPPIHFQNIGVQHYHQTPTRRKQ